ncbi:MAG: translocation/assembly module TamB domain-containing protein, partial [Ginsengibacter sp.]
MNNMESTQKELPEKKKRSLLSKLMRIFAWILASVIFLVILVLLLIQLPSVQNYGRKKVVSFLEGKLKTRVEIGKLDIKFPTDISLQKVFFEDQSKDTLLYGKELRVNLKMLQLLRSNVEIEEIYLDGIIGKVKRLPPDSVFNFQFIVDAFSSENAKTPETQDTSTLKLDINRIIVKNSHIIYDDPYSGNDMDIRIGLLDGKINKFDPFHLFFDIPVIKMKGIKGYYYQMEPLEKSIEKVVSEAASEEDNFLQLLNKTIKLSDIDIVFKSEPSKLYSSFKIGDMDIHPETIYLKNSVITLKDATLNQSAIAVQIESTAPIQPAKDTVILVETPSFKIISGKLNINKSSIRFDDLSAPRLPAGMDFSHLNLTNLSLNASNIRYNPDTIIANIHSANFKDTSGFVLKKLQTDFEMNPTGITLKNLLAETPGTLLKNSFAITYPSLEAMQKNPGVLGLDIDLSGSKISTQDILSFMPSMAGQLPSNSTLYIDARITGRVDNLDLQKLMLRGLNGTDIQVNGMVKGMPDTDRFYADLNIRKFQTTQKDIMAMVPKNTIPTTITLPQNMLATGVFRGSMTSLYTDLNINSSLGGAKITGTLGNITDKNRATYNMNIKARNIRVGTLIQNPELGSLTADAKVKGKGFNPETATILFDAAVSEITLKGYQYKNILAKGNLANKIYALNASVKDPNIDINIDAQGEFAGKFPGLKLKATIDSIKTFPLHLTTTEMMYHGVINGNFVNTDPDNLQGDLYVTHSIFVNEGKRVTLDSFSLNAKNENELQSLTMKADFFHAALEGKYKLTELGDVFQQVIDPYFSISEKKNVKKLAPYSFSINAAVVENPHLKTFLPELKRMDRITLDGQFASDSGWQMKLNSPFIEYGTNVIDHLELNATTANDAININTYLRQFRNGPSMVINATTLNGNIKDNQADFVLNIKDNKSKDMYTIAGDLAQISPDNYKFSLNPDSLRLNYEKWTVTPGNFIEYKNKDILAHNFDLSQDSQHLKINSISKGKNSPLKIEFQDFKISTLTSFVQTDSLLANGLLNGGAIVKDIQTQPTFTADLKVTDLSIYSDTIGTLTAKVDNNVANNYNAAVQLDGRGNKINIDGKYIVKPTNSAFDFVVNIDRFNMKSLEGLSNGAIKDARGFLYGKIALDGSMEDPNIDGKINFDNTAMNIRMLNNVFKVDKEAIAIINNTGIKLENFTIRDTANNALTLDGGLYSPNFKNYTFDMRIMANNFQAINSTNKDNDLFYGKMVFSTRLTVKGTPDRPIIDGDLTVNDGTDFTVVLPQDE